MLLNLPLSRSKLDRAAHLRSDSASLDELFSKAKIISMVADRFECAEESKEQYVMPKSDQNVCIICQDPYSEGRCVQLSYCSHILHYECLVGWLGAKEDETQISLNHLKCPCCKAIMRCDNNEDLVAILEPHKKLY